jgi:hypothetical protein
MGQDPAGGCTAPSKWGLATMAIQTMIDRYAYRLPLGLEMFTSLSTTDTGCYSDTHIDVPPAHGTGQLILQTLAGSGPLAGTNTGEAIKRAYTDGMLNNVAIGQYIVLITDGDPNCNALDQLGTATYTTSEIANALNRTPPIHTFVVGFDGSGGVNRANLDRMAVAGGVPQQYFATSDAGMVPLACDATKGRPCYYSAQAADAFLTAIDQIVGTLIIGGQGGCDDSCFAVGNECATGSECLFTSTEASCVSRGCFVAGCPAGQACGVVAQAPTCIADLCANVACSDGQFCRQGVCVGVCPTCGAGQRCVDGTCTPDPCNGAACATGKVCNPANGDCVENLCVGRMPICISDLHCDPVTGNCAQDPCALIHCPAGAGCHAGSCMLEAAPPPDLSVPPLDMAVPPPPDLYSSLPPPTPMANPARRGCSLAGPGADARPSLALLLLASALLARRLRRRS